MLTAIRHASMASKVIAIQAGLPPGTAEANSPTSPTATPVFVMADATASRPLANRPLPTATLLHMATLGGAELCNLETHTGSFSAGKAFDALLVNLLPETDNPNVWWDDDDDDGSDLEALLEKFLFCGDDRNISAVFVQGMVVGGSSFRRGLTVVP